MPRFTTTSSYTLNGDDKQTINVLMAVPQEGSSDISTLSTNNYPTSDKTMPNSDNQRVFMNQPLSWWLLGLNSGKIKYTPASNEVNWSYVDSSGNSIHISRNLSNVIIPNKSSSVTRDSKLNTMTIVFEAKHGINRTDVQTM
jgi:hemolysin activation/secretion protein